MFRGSDWREIRLDIDPSVEPDIVSSIADMRDAVADESFDAVWSSHNVEHLNAHEAPMAFREFRRVLRADGFALITCPDLRAVAELIVAGLTSRPIYTSPAGPIGAIDMLFGHSRSIAAGHVHMAHRTGYTAETIGELLIDAGFYEVWVTQGTAYDLWAVALKPDADAMAISRALARYGIFFPREVREDA